MHLSWGHDEYLYHVVKDYLPEEGLAMIRYHSFYPAHREGEYAAPDERPRPPIDSSGSASSTPTTSTPRGTSRPTSQALTPYYEDLIAEFFPAKIAW